jgi:hypothetical protein
LGWVDGGGGMAGPKKMSTVAVSRCAAPNAKTKLSLSAEAEEAQLM